MGAERVSVEGAAGFLAGVTYIRGLVGAPFGKFTDVVLRGKILMER